MLLLVLHTAEVKKKSLNTSFLIKYNEKYEGYSGEKWRKKQSRKQTNKNNDFIYSLCLYFSVSQQYWTQKLLCTANLNILGVKVNNSGKYFNVYLRPWTPLVTHTSRSPQTSWKLLSIYIIAKPKSGALVSLFSSPSLYWIKTVMKPFSTDCRRVSSRGFRDQSWSWGGGYVVNGYIK